MVERRQRIGKAADARPGGAHCVLLNQEDVRQLLSAIAAAGIQPHSHADDGLFRRAYINDPDGNELEIVQAL